MEVTRKTDRECVFSGEELVSLAESTKQNISEAIERGDVPNAFSWQQLLLCIESSRKFDRHEPSSITKLNSIFEILSSGKDTSLLAKEIEQLFDTLPFRPTQSQLHNIVTNPIIAPHQGDATIEFGGRFPWAGTTGYTPNLKIGKYLFNPIIINLDTLRFSVPSNLLTSEAVNKLYLTMAHLTLPWNRGVLTESREESSYPVPLLVAPSIGELSIQFQEIVPNQEVGEVKTTHFSFEGSKAAVSVKADEGWTVCSLARFSPGSSPPQASLAQDENQITIYYQPRTIGALSGEISFKQKQYRTLSITRETTLPIKWETNTPFTLKPNSTVTTISLKRYTGEVETFTPNGDQITATSFPPLVGTLSIKCTQGAYQIEAKCPPLSSATHDPPNAPDRLDSIAICIDRLREAIDTGCKDSLPNGEANSLYTLRKRLDTLLSTIQIANKDLLELSTKKVPTPILKPIEHIFQRMMSLLSFSEKVGRLAFSFDPVEWSKGLVEANPEETLVFSTSPHFVEDSPTKIYQVKVLGNFPCLEKYPPKLRYEKGNCKVEISPKDPSHTCLEFEVPVGILRAMEADKLPEENSTVTGYLESDWGKKTSWYGVLSQEVRMARSFPISIVVASLNQPAPPTCLTLNSKESN